MKGILGRKLGMTQVFTTDGELIPVTVIDVRPNLVVQKKTVATDGYDAVQLGYEDQKKSRITKPKAGHAAKANGVVKKYLREIRGVAMQEFEVGSEVTGAIFAAGDLVDVTGTSKGKGYSGAIKRNNQSLGPKTHGSGYHRGVGSLTTGGRTLARIAKGRIMAGQMGHVKTTNRNLEVIKVDEQDNYMLIKGNIPGPKRGLVIVKTTTKKIKHKEPVQLVDYSANKED